MANTYRIKNGDTLTSIAKKNNTTVDELVKLNGIKNPDLIYAGNTLNLPSQQKETAQKSSQSAATAPPSASSASDYTQYTYDASSDKTYQQAISALTQVQSKAPAYENTYESQLNDVYNQIMNRDKFSYDLNSDMLYQQYKDQYANMGQMAMKDTMGQAAALTGGYGSSYAQSVGQQQYDAYLQQLNDVIPELYGMAQDQYNAEGEALLNQYSLTADMSNEEYSKYMDAYNQWLSERDYAQQQADAAYDRGYTDYINSLNMAYQKERDAVSDSQWQAEFDEAKRQYEQNYALSSKASGGSGGGSSSGNYSSDVGDDAGNPPAAVPYQSSFKELTGDNRFNNTGSLFTEQQYRGFQQSVGMCRGDEGKASLIDDAVMEGKITSAQANELLKRYGISDDEFRAYRAASQASTDRVKAKK